MADRLQGKIAFVTGAAGGIGRCVVERFEAEGAEVVAADVAPTGGGVALDVTSADGVARAFTAVGERFGRLDVLVNCAAIEIEKTVEQTSEAEWDRLMAINLKGTFLACKRALPLMRRAGGGSIVNFGSYDGFMADPNLAAYCASKGGVHALTRAIAADHGHEGIRCNAVCPGYVDTPMLRSFFGDAGDADSLRAEIGRIHPIGRVGTPRDIANMVLWLASDEAAFATGQLFIVDGGLTARAPQMRS